MSKRKWSFAMANQVTVMSMKRHRPLEGHPLYPKVRDTVTKTLGWLTSLDNPTIRGRLPNLLPNLLNQLGRSATSVSANLAEGEGRTRSTGHYRQFLLISRGSLVESIDHFTSLGALEKAWSDLTLEPVTEMETLWKDLLEAFDTFLASALDPEDRGAKILQATKIGATSSSKVDDEPRADDEPQVTSDDSCLDPAEPEVIELEP